MLPSDRKNLGCVGGSGNTSSLCWAEPPAHLQSRGPCVGTSAWGRIPPYHWAGNSRAASICSSVLQCGSDGSALWVRPRGPALECCLGVVPNHHPWVLPRFWGVLLDLQGKMVGACMLIPGQPSHHAQSDFFNAVQILLLAGRWSIRSSTHMDGVRLLSQ